MSSVNFVRFLSARSTERIVTVSILGMRSAEKISFRFLSVHSVEKASIPLSQPTQHGDKFYFLSEHMQHRENFHLA